MSAPPGAIRVRRRLGVSEKDRNPALDAGFSSTCRSRSPGTRRALKVFAPSKDETPAKAAAAPITGEDAMILGLENAKALVRV